MDHLSALEGKKLTLVCFQSNIDFLIQMTGSRHVNKVSSEALTFTAYLENETSLKM
jgi:hypothetical protein